MSDRLSMEIWSLWYYKTGIQAVTVSVLLYGCKTWTLEKCQKKLDVNYSKTLYAVLNEPCKYHPTKQQLYGHLLPISQTIQISQARYAGHSWINKDVLLWTSTNGHTSLGCPAKTYQLCEVIGCRLEDLPRTIVDRDGWQVRERKRERERERECVCVSWEFMVSSCLHAADEVSLVGLLVVLFYGVLILFGSFNAVLSHFDKSFKQFNLL